MKKFAQWLFENDVKQIDIAKKLGIGTTTMHALVKTDRIPTLQVALDIEELTDGAIKPQDWLPKKKIQEKPIAKKIKSTEKKK